MYSSSYFAAFISLAVPAISQTITSDPSGSTFLGCYTDSGNRILNGSFTSPSDNTIESCHATCAGQSYKYFGVEYSQQCFCGNDLVPGNPKADSDSSCGWACSGNSSEVCGGYWLISLYQLSGDSSSPGISSSGPSITSSNSLSQTSSDSSSAPSSKSLSITSSDSPSASLSSSKPVTSPSSAASSTASSSNSSPSSVSSRSSGSSSIPSSSSVVSRPSSLTTSLSSTTSFFASTSSRARPRPQGQGHQRSSTVTSSGITNSPSSTHSSVLFPSSRTRIRPQGHRSSSVVAHNAGTPSISVPTSVPTAMPSKSAHHSSGGHKSSPAVCQKLKDQQERVNRAIQALREAREVVDAFLLGEWSALVNDNIGDQENMISQIGRLLDGGMELPPYFRGYQEARTRVGENHLINC